jgi:hypothetical protein
LAKPFRLPFVSSNSEKSLSDASMRESNNAKEAVTGIVLSDNIAVERSSCKLSGQKRAKLKYKIDKECIKKMISLIKLMMH